MIPRRRALVALVCLLAALIRPTSARAHTPITTKIHFNREVIRILQANCLGCHRKGGIAPMSLASYQEARPWAKAIKEELLEKRMPPWPAVRGFGQFRNAPRLSQRDIDTIVNWVEGGAPRGYPQDLPADPLFSSDWSLGQPDLVLTPDAANEVAADADQRRDFVLATRLPAESWMTAIELKPGEGSVVHCATVSLDGSRPALLGTWVPGSMVTALPDGIARRIPANARLRVGIHYRGSGQAVADRSSVGLYFKKTANLRELQQIALTTARSSIRMPEAADAVGVVPLADARVASVQATVYPPGGAPEVLLWTRGLRDDWRATYFFKSPVRLPKGSRVEAIVHLREPDPERRGAGGVAATEPILTLLYTSATALPKPAPGS